MSKKLIALVLAFALVFSTFSVAFAEEAIGADAQVTVALGMLKGEGNGVNAAYLAKSSTRIQAAIMFLRLKGLEQDALKFTGTANFTDAAGVKSEGNKAVMAYLKANPQLGWTGVGSNLFAPSREISTAEYYKVMLAALGFEQGTDFEWSNVMTFANGKGLSKVAAGKAFTNNDIAIATVEGLKANVKGATKTLATALVEANVIAKDAAVAAGLVTGTATVSSIVANSAKSFKVTFGSAVADTSKVAFTVKRGTVNATLTTTWNAEKTEATLSSTSKLVEDTYTIAVKSDATELSSKEIKIEQEKVAKIEFLADTLVRANDWTGYVPVKISNQYGEDVTDAPLGMAVTFTGGDSATLVKNTGKVLVVKGDNVTPVYALTDLKYMTMVVVTAFDSNSGTFASKTLKVSDTVGGVAEIAFKGLVDKNGNAVTLSQTTNEEVYMNYEAKDAFGNIVNDYATLNNTSIINFFSSNNAIATIAVKQDSLNNTKAKLVVAVADKNSTWAIDMPVVFTAVAYTSGKSTTLSTTVGRKAAVGTVQISAPTTQVAAGETAVIPLTALDLNGKEMKSWTDLNGIAANINISGPAAVVKTEDRTANGDYVLKMTFNTAGKYFVTATVPSTGKMSQFTLDVKATAVPKTLASMEGIFAANFAPSATQSKDFGADFGGLVNIVKDQFDRAYDMSYQTRYELQAVSSDTDLFTVTANNAKQAAPITIAATAGETDLGTAKITFNLVDTNDGSVVDTVSVNLTKVSLKDITSYSISAITPVYATGHSRFTSDANYVLTDAGKVYDASVTVSGITASGAKVRIPSSMIVARSTNDSRFAFNGNDVYAKFLGNGVAEATAKVFVSIIGYNNTLYTVSQDVTAKSAEAVASSIYVDVPYDMNVKVNNDLNTITMSEADFAAIDTNSIFNFNASGAAEVNAYDKFTVSVDDNYGKTAIKPAYVNIVKLTGTGTATFAVDSTTGIVTMTANANGVDAGDQYVLTAVSNNGLVCTYKIVIE